MDTRAESVEVSMTYIQIQFWHMASPMHEVTFVPAVIPEKNVTSWYLVL